MTTVRHPVEPDKRAAAAAPIATCPGCGLPAKPEQLVRRRAGAAVTCRDCAATARHVREANALIVAAAAALLVALHLAPG